LTRHSPLATRHSPLPLQRGKGGGPRRFTAIVQEPSSPVPAPVTIGCMSDGGDCAGAGPVACLV